MVYNWLPNLVSVAIPTQSLPIIATNSEPFIEKGF